MMAPRSTRLFCHYGGADDEIRPILQQELNPEISLCDWRGRATQSMDVRHEDTSASVVMVLRRVFSGRIRVTIFVVVGFIEVTQVSKNCSLLCRV